jgi:hypothetical protein
MKYQLQKVTMILIAITIYILLGSFKKNELLEVPNIFILAPSVSSTYAFSCAINCPIKSITTSSTNKKLIFSSQTAGCVTISNTDGTNSITLSKDKTYYVKNSALGVALSFKIKSNSSITFANCFEQQTDGTWIVPANYTPAVPLSEWDLTAGRVLYCGDPTLCVECQ